MTNSPADSILDFEGWELVGCSRLEQGELAKYGPAGCTVFMVELVCRADGEVVARADLYVPEEVAMQLAQRIYQAAPAQEESHAWSSDQPQDEAGRTAHGRASTDL